MRDGPGALPGGTARLARTSGRKSRASARTAPGRPGLRRASLSAVLDVPRRRAPGPPGSLSSAGGRRGVDRRTEAVGAADTPVPSSPPKDFSDEDWVGGGVPFSPRGREGDRGDVGGIQWVSAAVQARTVAFSAPAGRRGRGTQTGEGSSGGETASAASSKGSLAGWGRPLLPPGERRGSRGCRGDPVGLCGGAGPGRCVLGTCRSAWEGEGPAQAMPASGPPPLSAFNTRSTSVRAGPSSRGSSCPASATSSRCSRCRTGCAS